MHLTSNIFLPLALSPCIRQESVIASMGLSNIKRGVALFLSLLPSSPEVKYLHFLLEEIITSL